MMKSAVVVAPFISFESPASRPNCVAHVLARFSTVDIITTDLDHQTKSAREQKQYEPFRRIFYLKTIPYNSNRSLRRLLSHAVFSLRAAWFYWRRSFHYDAVYVTVPLNLLACIVLHMSRGKTRIVDIVDIWPDVLPFSHKLRISLAPLLWMWKRLFIISIRQADQLMAVSDRFYQEGIRYFSYGPESARRFYIGHRTFPEEQVERAERFTIAYVGNIGHVYDFDTLLKVLADEDMIDRCQLFIVGDGDRRAWLLNELDRRNILHTYFGVVYEPDKLSGILRRSHLGFNGYVNTTAAFSYKAATYLSAGLPILNSMKGDLKELVDDRKLGFNYHSLDPSSLKQAILQCDPAKLSDLSQNCSLFAHQELRLEVVEDRMGRFLQKGAWLKR